MRLTDDPRRKGDVFFEDHDDKPRDPRWRAVGWGLTLTGGVVFWTYLTMWLVTL